MLSLRHLSCLAGLCLALASGLSWAEKPALDYPIDSSRVLLLNIVDSGKQLVAVGERGVVMLSADQASTWKSIRTPSNRTLTGVAFVSPEVGVAVGHGGTVLRTEDGGQSWTPVEADTNGDALLGVVSMGQGRLVTWGAFGLYLISNDAGATWERISIIDPDFDRHISQIIGLIDGRWLLVGESGTMAVSADRGMTWERLESPYQGSYFGALQAASGDLFLFGMRGNMWHSSDAGATWSKAETGTTIAFNGGLQLKSGRILVFGNSGLIMASDDQGEHFQRLPATQTNLAKALQLKAGDVVAVGDRGVMTIDAGRQE